jgi:GTPase
MQKILMAIECDAVVRERRMRIPSKQLLNMLSENIVHKMPSSGRKQLRVKYATQANLATPTFLVFVNHVDLATAAYTRFVESCIRQYYPFIGSPMRILVRASNRKAKRTTKK